jgi:hypothetical protein
MVVGPLAGNHPIESLEADSVHSYKVPACQEVMRMEKELSLQRGS